MIIRTTKDLGHLVRDHRSQRSLTQAQLDRLVRAIQSARDGDFTVRLRPEGPLSEVATALNALVERNQQVTREFVRISKVVGREGRVAYVVSMAQMHDAGEAICWPLAPWCEQLRVLSPAQTRYGLVLFAAASGIVALTFSRRRWTAAAYTKGLKVEPGWRSAAGPARSWTSG